MKATFIEWFISTVLCDLRNATHAKEAGTSMFMRTITFIFIARSAML
jgi:hypothetical protein